MMFPNLSVEHVLHLPKILQNPTKRARIDSDSDEEEDSTQAKYKKALSRSATPSLPHFPLPVDSTPERDREHDANDVIVE